MQLVIRRNINHTLVMIKRNLIHLLRNPEAMVMTALLPILLTLVFVYAFGGALDPGGDRTAYLKYVLPGIVVMIPSFGAYIIGVSVYSDMSEGINDRFRTMNIHQSSVLGGHMIASLLRNIIGVIIVIAFAYLIGFRTDVSAMNWLAVTGICMLYFAMIISLSIMVGLLVGSAESVSGVLMFVQLAPYVSSTFVPTETMPKALASFANYQPFTPITNTIRGLMLGNEIGNDWMIAIAWCVGITVVCLVISMHVYKHKTT